MTDQSTIPIEQVPSLDPPPAAGQGARWPRRKLLMVAGIATAAVVVLAWLVAFSPLFGVRHVRVTGATGDAAAEVAVAAAVPHGSALLRLDTASVADRVRALPWVATATAHTSFPSTVVIDVVPRVAVGYERTAAGYRLVDKTGHAYQSAAKPPARLPQFALPGGSGATAAGAAAATVAAALSPGERSIVAVVQARSADSITLVLRDQRVVQWGSTDRSAEKAALLPALLHQPGTTFDVSDPDLVVAH